MRFYGGVFMAPAIPECIPIENDVKRNDLFDSD